jgi:hypothetical protein
MITTTFLARYGNQFTINISSSSSRALQSVVDFGFQYNFNTVVLSSQQICFYGIGMSIQCRTPNLEDQGVLVWNLTLDLSSLGDPVSSYLWAGIIGDLLTAPYKLLPRLSGASYLHFLTEELPQLLENVPMATGKTRGMHDGAPAHFTHNIKQILNSHYSD